MGGDGLIIEYYLLDDKEVADFRNQGRRIIEFGWTKLIYTPKFDFTLNDWAEGLSQEEIDAILNTPQPLSEMEELKKQLADLGFQLMLNGVL